MPESFGLNPNHRVLRPWGGYWIVQTALSQEAHIAFDPPHSPHWKNEAYFPTKELTHGFVTCLAHGLEEEEKRDLYLVGKHQIYTRRPELKNIQRLMDSGYVDKPRGYNYRLVGYGPAIYESLEYMVLTDQWVEP